MRSLLVFALLWDSSVAVLLGPGSLYVPETLSWDDWRMIYPDAYLADAIDRQSIYQSNIDLIENHNARADMGLETYRLGVNQYAALSLDEYIDQYLGEHNLNKPKRYADHSDNPDPPATIDWRELGAVTAVKNQGMCGSCWSFSTTGAIEGHSAIKTGKLVSLSEQQLMDCSRAYGDMSCNGGLMDNAFQYVVDNHGLDSEADYPYKMKDESCNKAKASHHVASITDYKDVESEDSELEAALAIGPVSVGIEAGHPHFQLYRSGIYTGKECGTSLNHGVLAVGYTSDYWIVKNSWGTTWGSEGYIHMARGTHYGEDGVCGILMAASYPIAEMPEPSPPTPGPDVPTPPPTESPIDDDMQYYENPWTNGHCHDGEIPVMVQGIDGSYCAPKCHGKRLKHCPKTPDGWKSAHAMCALQTPGGDKYCGIICMTSDPNACAHDKNATCKDIGRGVGLCTYDEQEELSLRPMGRLVSDIIEEVATDVMKVVMNELGDKL